MMNCRTLFSSLFIVFMLSGCVQNVASKKSADFVAFDNDEKSKVIYLPAEITVNELGVTSAEEVPEWSQEAKQNVDGLITRFLLEHPDIDLVQSDQLDDQDVPVIEEHLALYDVVAASFMTAERLPGWQNKRANFSATLGDGLKFLKEKYDAESALVVIGDDYVSSGGRQATFVLAAIAGVAIQMGHSVMHVGLVDLETGKVLWTDTSFSTTHSLKSDSGAYEMLAGALESMPNAQQSLQTIRPVRKRTAK